MPDNPLSFMVGGAIAVIALFLGVGLGWVFFSGNLKLPALLPPDQERNPQIAGAKANESLNWWDEDGYHEFNWVKEINSA